MIEFKAECGHTVRARDEDAGGVVRCSYCGKNANVPEESGNALDFLFDDIAQPAEAPAGSRKGGRSGARTLFGRRRRTGEFNPFAVVLRLCYAALLIIVVVVIARKFVIPLFKDGTVPREFTLFNKAEQRPAEKPARGEEEASVRQRPGLLEREKLAGLYVSSTPPGATAYCVETSKAPDRGRIHKVKGCKQLRTGASLPRLADGVYVVEVVFPWNDPRLTSYDDYLAFRRSIQRASERDRIRLLDSYFVPDEATDVFIDETKEQIFIVRQYRGVEVRSGHSKGVRALFIPKIIAQDGWSLAVEEIVTGYTPDRKAYEFDEQYVRSELAYYDVEVSDQPFIVEALKRIGMIPYITPDRRTRLFKIDIHDGNFAARVLPEPG